MIGDGHNSILRQEDMAFDGYQLRSMSTLGFPENDMVNPCQNNKQCFPFISEKTCYNEETILKYANYFHMTNKFNTILIKFPTGFLKKYEYIKFI